MAVEITFIPGATTSNCSLPAFAPDIGSMPTTTVAGWDIIYPGMTSIAKYNATRATAYTARTFNAKTVVGKSDHPVTVKYNAIDEFVRT